jgi:hypothetical protein
MRKEDPEIGVTKDVGSGRYRGFGEKVLVLGF